MYMYELHNTHCLYAHELPMLYATNIVFTDTLYQSNTFQLSPAMARRATVSTAVREEVVMTALDSGVISAGVDTVRLLLWGSLKLEVIDVFGLLLSCVVL